MWMNKRHHIMDRRFRTSEKKFSEVHCLVASENGSSAVTEKHRAMMADLEGARLISQNRHSYSSIDRVCDSDIEESKLSQPTPNKGYNRLLTILFGQIIALLSASTNAASFTLEYGMKLGDFPMFMMFPAYVILSLNLWSRPTIKDESPHGIPLTSIRLRTPWWYYVCLSALDLLPNYLTLVSLNHTSLTSATLLGSLTVPSTMLVCGLVLGKKYRLANYVGVILCLSGGAQTLLIDINHSSHPISASSHPHSYYGDLLAASAAILYGIADAASEFWSKHVDRKEYLGMIGLHGAVVSFVIFLLFERNAVLDTFEDSRNFFPALGLMLWYIPSLVSFYVFATLFLVSSDAALLTLSLQSSNLWAILFSIVAFGESPPLLFCVSVVLVVAGVTVYELLGNAAQDTTSESNIDNTSPTTALSKDSFCDEAS
jgi:solute carrier family 35 protein F1/2